MPLLHHTIRLGDLHACKLLLDHGVHPLVCAGFCEQCGSVDEEKDECEDAVRYALHAASTSNRRNTIAVLLQTHLYSIVTGITKACEASDMEQLDRFIPRGLRLSCAFSILANPPGRDQSDSDSSHRLLAALGTVVEEAGSTWNALMGSGIQSQAVASAVALSSGGIRLGKRLLNATSETVTQMAINSWSMFNTQQEPVVNFLNRAQLLGWTRSCLGRLLLLCVRERFVTGLDSLLRVGFRVHPVRLGNSSLRQDCLTQLPPDRGRPSAAALRLLLVQESILDHSANEQGAPLHSWCECTDQQMDSAVHAAVRLGRLDMLELILQHDSGAAALSIPDPGVGALPLHTAAAWGRTDCVRRLLSCVNNSQQEQQPLAPPNLSDSHESAVDPTNGSPDTDFVIAFGDHFSNHQRTFSCRLNGLPAIYRSPFW
ncbi:hypothetical protein P879_07935 [Paragonimus westermani]|uniref:ANK_REP_REGION domain-containing protein n=1 Tax=Paragonimus westermani TaxID=34504 RepID=A0A8T0D4F2_9TREM|nr:hypothetical protein P879_07935 [Paragonimus westermani]